MIIIMPETTAIAGLIIFGATVLVAAMALLMPFFVYRIRKEIISMNKKLGILIDLQSFQASASPLTPDQRPNERKCIKCGARNRIRDLTCMACGEPIPDMNQ